MIHAALDSRPSPLLRALRRSAQAFGIDPVVVVETERPWATATFVGTSCRVVLDADPSQAFAAWLAMLPDAELDLRHAVVVDLVVEAPATITALLMQIDTPTTMA